jgi:hypothetical protein
MPREECLLLLNYLAKVRIQEARFESIAPSTYEVKAMVMMMNEYALR